jgi:hypothetical protein
MVSHSVAYIANLRKAAGCEDAAGPFHYRSQCLAQWDDEFGVVGVEPCSAAVVLVPVTQL